MKNCKMLTFIALILASLFSVSAVIAQEVIIQNDDPIEIEAGESEDLEAVFLDDLGAEVDTTFIWTIEPEDMGTINGNSMFFAELAGEGIIIATVGDYADTVAVIIEEAEEPESNLTIVPGDTIVAVGTQIQFQAYLLETPVDAIWSMIGEPVGTLSDGGLLDVTANGFSFIQTNVEGDSTTSLVIVEDEPDTAGTNSITITRSTPNPQGYTVMAEITEGQSWTIGGLPRPLNILNGGQIYFPNGSLHEDIRLHIDLPGFANVHGDSVGFGGEIVTGVSFQIYVGEEIVEPYYFDDPLFVGLIFKRGLLNHLNINPEDLALYFAVIEGDTVVFDTTGISNTIVDPIRNRIFSNVIHFSDLVVAPNDVITGTGNLSEAGLPAEFVLEQNYPNPFNPITNISYNVPLNSGIRLYVYDILGREVTRLVDSQLTAGYHTVLFNGEGLASGIYYIRLGDNSSWLQTRKMVLMK